MTSAHRDKPLLALDVGNTSVKCALIEAEQIEPVFRVSTLPAPGLKGRLGHALSASGVSVAPEARLVVSSVCPAADAAVTALGEGLGKRAEFLGRDRPVPMPTSIAAPDRVGVDRLLLALGARELVGAPCIVVSAGTAITVDLVDADGVFAGGAIAPGFALCARAMHESTALLPLIEPEAPPQAVGTDTAAALKSGIYWTCTGGVLALAARYRERPGCGSAPLICTGTDAPLLLPALPPEGTSDVPELIFRGMVRAVAAAAV